MQIQLNGEAYSLDEPTTLTDLVERLGLAGKRLAIELNLEIVPRSQFAETQVVASPETLVRRPDTHPMAYLADWMADQGFATSRIGYESDSYFFSPRALAALQSGLPDARFIDADLLVNWQRLVKSPAELEVMRGAARLAEAVNTRAERAAGLAERLAQADVGQTVAPASPQPPEQLSLL